MKFKKLAIFAFGATLIFLGAIFTQTPKESDASIMPAGEYQSSMATSTMASATVGNLIKTGSGTLGSVVITTAASTGAYLRVWDATSTATSTYQTMDNTSTTQTYGRLVAQFKTAAGEGTYTFDASLFKGLVLEIPSSWNGSYVITYR